MIVAGFGFSTRATAASLRDALAQAQGNARPDACLAALATAQDKAESEAFHALAKALDLPIRAIPARVLTAQTPLTRSERALAARGTGSVAEAAALAAAGPGARLLGGRIHSTDRMASCALAQGDTP